MYGCPVFMKKVAVRLFRGLRKTIAWLFILLLLIHACISLLFSHLNYFRQKTEDALTHLLGSQVYIQKIDASLFFINPTIKLHQFSLINNDGKRTQTIENIRFSLSLIDSLRDHQLVIKSVSLDNANIHLTNNSGKWSLLGIPTSNNKVGDTKSQAMKLLSHIQKIKFSTVNLSVYDSAHQTINIVNIKSLRGRNSSNKFLLKGLLVLNHSPVKVVSTIDISPVGNKPNGFSTYVTTELMDLKPWVGLLSSKDLPTFKIEQLPVKAKLWLKWKPDQWYLTGNIYTPNSQLYVNNSLFSIEDLTGKFSVTGKRLQPLSGSIQTSEFRLNNAQFKASTLTADYKSISNHSYISLKAPTLDINSLKKVATNSSLLSANLKKIIKDLDPEGQLNNTIVTLYPDKKPLDFSVTSTFSKLSLNEWNGVPSITNISGQMFVTPKHSVFDIDSENSTVGLTDLFNHPWIFNKIKGRFYLTQTNSKYSLLANHIETSQRYENNQETSAQTFLKLDIPHNPDELDHITLDVKVDQMSALKTQDYIPYKILSDGLGEWLRDSVPEGKITNTEFSMKGPLNSKGTDQLKWNLNLHINDGLLHYSSAWPDVSHLNTIIHINQDGLAAHHASGKMGQSTLNNFDVAVKNFRNPILQVQAEALLNGKGVEDLLQKTPINQQLGKAPERWHITGNYSTQLSLSLPINEDKAKPEITVKTKTSNGSFAIPNQKIQLDKLVGDISYSSSNGLNSQQLSSSFLGSPAILKINSQTLADNKKITNIYLNSQTQVSQFNAFTPKYLQSMVAGNIKYRVHIGIPESGKYFVQFNSDLKGTDISLPGVYKKSADTKMPFRLLLTSENIGSTVIYTHYGNLLNGVFGIKKGQLTSGNLTLNPTSQLPLTLPDNSFIISGSLPVVHLDKWINWRQKNIGASDNSIFGQLNVLAKDIKIDQLFYKRQDLRNVVISGHTDKKDTAVKFTSDKVTGLITIAPHKPYVINLDTLRLPQKLTQLFAGKNKAENIPLEGIDINQIPDMQVFIKQLFFDKKQLGHATFAIKHMTDAVEMQDIDVDLGGVTVKGTAHWDKSAHHSKTQFTGTLSTQDLEQALKNWGITNNRFTSNKADVNVDLSWLGSPMNFDLMNLKGTADFTFRSGLIKTDKSSSSLKLLGLFNIDAITRRLKFDFSDLFESGISFDKIFGRIRVDHGLVDIYKPLTIDGPSSNFILEGVINIPEQKVDASIIAVLPVTQNLPLLGLLFGQPVLAGAVFLFDKLVGKTLTKFSSVRYDIEGSLSDPVITMDKLFANKFKKHSGHHTKNDNK